MTYKLEPHSNAEILFDEEAHCYRVDGEIKYGPNQLMSMVGLGVKVAEMQEPMKSNFEQAGRRGKIIHKWTELIDLGQESLYDPQEEGIRPYLEAWKLFVKEYEVKFLEIEKPHYSVYGDYCGTPDRIALVKNLPYVIDIKSSKTINGCSKLQTMAYSNFFKGALRRMIVQIKEDGTLKIYDDGLYGSKYLNDESDALNWDAVIRISKLIRQNKSCQI